MPYTSRDEITMAIEDCVKDGLGQDIDPDVYAMPFVFRLIENRPFSIDISLRKELTSALC
jgi:hypothetical protein